MKKLILKTLHRFVVCVTNFKNKLLMTKVLLNIRNLFIFLIIQLLKEIHLKKIIIIHCHNTLRLKSF